MPKHRLLAINLALRPESPVKIFPIGLAYVLSSVRRAGYEFDLLDIDLDRPSETEQQKKLSERPWDVVMLGCIVTGYGIVKRITAEIRQCAPNALIVVGNSVASSIPSIILTKTDADVAVIGEGDITIVDVLNKWLSNGNLEDVKGIWYKQDGRIYQNAERTVIEDINSIPLAFYDIFDVEAYIQAHIHSVGEPLPRDRASIRAFPVNTARGCVHKCTFCYHCFIGQKYRYRSAHSIIEEVKLLQQKYGINYIQLWDDLTFFSKKQIRKFVDLLLEEKVKVNWAGAVRGNLFQHTNDLALLGKMRKAGCLILGYALESADQDILKDMNKKVSLDQFRKQKQLLDKAGISSGTSIVLGYPRETPETIAKTFEFCRELELYPSSGFLLPQPATRIYQWAVEKGFIADEEAYLMRLGDRQDLRLNLTGMTDREFNEAVIYWLRRLNKELNVGLDEKQLIKTGFRREKN